MDSKLVSIFFSWKWMISTNLTYFSFLGDLCQNGYLWTNDFISYFWAYMFCFYLYPSNLGISFWKNIPICQNNKHHQVQTFNYFSYLFLCQISLESYLPDLYIIKWVHLILIFSCAFPFFSVKSTRESSVLKSK